MPDEPFESTDDNASQDSLQYWSRNGKELTKNINGLTKLNNKLKSSA
jgi:hypothetical protein